MSSQLLKRVRASAGRAKRRLKDIIFPVEPDPLDVAPVRREIANRYLCGQGIEIGALHRPMLLPPCAKVRYVDRMSVDDLRKQYPELATCDLVPVDVIENGEMLTTFKENSEDFIIACHLIEHTQDPIGSLKNWLRVLKPGGILYLGVPHKAMTFDKDRAVTPLEHLIRDHADGPQHSRLAHYEEWVRLVNKVPEERVAHEVRHLSTIDYSIHFHVWTECEFLELMLHCMQREKMPFDLEHFQRNHFEFILILRKK